MEPRTPPSCPAAKVAVAETKNFVAAGSEADCPASKSSPSPQTLIADVSQMMDRLS